jgi:hypothetical protein
MPKVSITDPADPPPYPLPQLKPADVVLLPMHMEGDQAIYADGTTMAVNRLRALGIQAEGHTMLPIGRGMENAARRK